MAFQVFVWRGRGVNTCPPGCLVSIRPTLKVWNPPKAEKCFVTGALPAICRPATSSTNSTSRCEVVQFAVTWNVSKTTSLSHHFTSFQKSSQAVQKNNSAHGWVNSRPPLRCRRGGGVHQRFVGCHRLSILCELQRGMIRLAVKKLQVPCIFPPGFGALGRCAARAGLRERKRLFPQPLGDRNKGMCRRVFARVREPAVQQSGRLVFEPKVGR